MGNAESRASKQEALENPYIKRIIEARQQLTGWERLKLVFKTNQFGELSPEVQRIIFATTLGLAIGAFIGSVGRGRIARENFLRNNVYEVYETPLEAKRKLQDSVTVGMGQGAFRIGWRIGVFTFLYMSASTAVSTYRGKMGVIDQVIGASTAGFIYKFMQGPKAAISGATIGSLLGLTTGLITLGVTQLNGETIDSANLHYYHHVAKREEKSKMVLDSLRKYAKDSLGPTIINTHEDDFELRSEHDKHVAELKLQADKKASLTETAANDQIKSESEDIIQDDKT